MHSTLSLALAGAALVAAVPVDISNWPQGIPRAYEIVGNDNLMRGAELQKRASGQAAPHFVIYDDSWVNQGSPPDPSTLDEWNVWAISFWWPSGPQDMAQGWQELTAAQRTTVHTEYANAGIKLMVAAFGSIPTPTSSGDDPATVAQDLATFVKNYELDGTDIDYEDFAAMNGGTAEDWIITFQKELRSLLPAPTYIITHAPVAPWFTDSGRYAISESSVGGYLYIDQQVGPLIDWYNVQFYNQDDYTTCESLLTTSSNPDWPDSALFQIVANGVDMQKLVIGKPATTADASNGYVDPATLKTCVAEAKASGWSAGLMLWQYPHQSSGFIEEVWGAVSTVATTTSGKVTTTTTTSVSTTTTATGGVCAGVSAWSTGVAYTGGSKVTYNGHLWTASYWTENDTPGGSAGVWVDGGACTSSRFARGYPTPAPRAY